MAHANLSTYREDRVLIHIVSWGCNRLPSRARNISVFWSLRATWRRSSRTWPRLLPAMSRPAATSRTWRSRLASSSRSICAWPMRTLPWRRSSRAPSPRTGRTSKLPIVIYFFTLVFLFFSWNKPIAREQSPLSQFSIIICVCAQLEKNKKSWPFTTRSGQWMVCALLRMWIRCTYAQPDNETLFWCRTDRISQTNQITTNSYRYNTEANHKGAWGFAF